MKMNLADACGVWLKSKHSPTTDADLALGNYQRRKSVDPRLAADATITMTVADIEAALANAAKLGRVAGELGQ